MSIPSFGIRVLLKFLRFRARLMDIARVMKSCKLSNTSRLFFNDKRKKSYINAGLMK